jgi:hypothetical protein
MHPELFDPLLISGAVKRYAKRFLLQEQIEGVDSDPYFTLQAEAAE